MYIFQLQHRRILVWSLSQNLSWVFRPFKLVFNFWGEELIFTGTQFYDDNNNNDNNNNDDDSNNNDISNNNNNNDNNNNNFSLIC